MVLCVGMELLSDGNVEWRYNAKWDLGDNIETIWGDERLSLKAKGVWGYMRSKPPMWDFSASRMANESLDARKAVLGAMKELERFGYLSRSKLGNGRVVYVLSANSYIGVEPEVVKSPLVVDKVKAEEIIETSGVCLSNPISLVVLAYSAYGVSRERVKDVLDRFEIMTCEQAREWMDKTDGVELIGQVESVPF